MKKTLYFFTAISIMLFFLAANVEINAQTKRLTWTAGDSTLPDMKIDASGILHFIYEDDTFGYPNKEIYYKKSMDNGTTWPASKRLTWNSGESRNPRIDVSPNGHIHVAWSDDTSGNEEIYYKNSIDGGASWSSAKRLTWNSGLSKTPVVGTNSNNHIYVFWYDDTSGNFDIYYRVSTNGGSFWAATRRITWSSSSYKPEVAIESNNNIHVFWLSYVNVVYGSEIFYKKSVDGGVAWSAPKRLTWGADEWTSPSTFRVAINADNLHIAYIHMTFQFNFDRFWTDVYYRRSTDGGTNWAPLQRLTWTPLSYYSANMLGMDIAVDSSNNPYIVYDNATPGNREIFIKYSSNGGVSFSGTRLTWTTGSSVRPSVGIDLSSVYHVIWPDETPGNYEIYYRK